MGDRSKRTTPSGVTEQVLSPCGIQSETFVGVLKYEGPLKEEKTLKDVISLAKRQQGGPASDGLMPCSFAGALLLIVTHKRSFSKSMSTCQNLFSDLEVV